VSLRVHGGVDVHGAPVELAIVGGRIAARASDVPAGAPLLDASGLTVAPGLLDLQVNGAGGVDVTSQPERLGELGPLLARHGVTGFLPTVITSAAAARDGALAALAALRRAPAPGAVPLGLHFEGPMLAPARKGAHPAHLLREASAEVVAGWSRDAGVTMVTLAPELPGALDAVRRLVTAGVTVALGHTDATYDVAREALDAGASVGTHLFNAMRGLHQREPGPPTALLEHPDAFVELIADGVHLHPAVLRLAATAKPHHFLLVTDAMAAAAGDDGDYQLGPMAVTVRDGVARLTDSEMIAGSTLTMAAAVRYAVREAGLALPDVVRAATTTPATMLGLARVGALRPGFAADLVVLDQDLRVTGVMKAGRWVTPAA